MIININIYTNSMIVNVQQDGCCMFRCILLYLTKEFRKYERFKNGKIKKRTIQQKENLECQKLRHRIVDYINKNKEKYENINYMDNEYYINIDDRLEKMKENTEYGGIIELDAASILFNIKIEVYTNELNKIAIFNETKRKVCKLILDEEHYNLII